MLIISQTSHFLSIEVVQLRNQLASRQHLCLFRLTKVIGANEQFRQHKFTVWCCNIVVTTPASRLTHAKYFVLGVHGRLADLPLANLTLEVTEATLLAAR